MSSRFMSFKKIMRVLILRKFYKFNLVVSEMEKGI